MDRRVVVWVSLAAACLIEAYPAHAQTFETIGTRAQGMGGAFVAVADDATATWWNPAGIAVGPMFNALWERGTTTMPGEEFGAGPAWRGDNSGFAFAMPAMGLSYYRLRVSDIQPAEDGGVGLRTFATSQYGLTVGQSLGSAVVLATTLKLVRAGRMFGPGAETGDAALDAAADLDVEAETSTGLDAGALVNLGVARVGVTIRNLRQPEFGEAEQAFELERQVRGGMALTAGRFGIFDSAIAAVDWDFTTTETALGEARQLAFGGEIWTAASRIGLRAGLSRNTVGLKDQTVSAGLSLGPAQGFFLDGVWTFGSAESRRGWGVSARVTF